MDSVKVEVDLKEIHLAKLSEKEGEAEAKAVDLNCELDKVSFKLEPTIVVGTKVKDNTSYLCQTIQNLTVEAKEAKVAEAVALNQINDLSRRENTVASLFNSEISLSQFDFNSLSRLVDKKVVAVMAQKHVTKSWEEETLSKLQVANREIEGKRFNYQALL
ncbi:hypothetical protein KI387_031924, partial [Taxus chinensis]